MLDINGCLHDLDRIEKRNSKIASSLIQGFLSAGGLIGVRRLCGDVVDWKINAIPGTGASYEDLEAAIAWAAGEDDVMGEERRPLTGAATQVYDILAADEEFGDEEGHA